jgi:hypothetical protein
MPGWPVKLTDPVPAESAAAAPEFPFLHFDLTKDAADGVFGCLFGCV